MGEIGAILLAAGQGKRMCSSLPKVSHALCGKPLLLYPLSAARSLGAAKIVIVIGHAAEAVRRCCPDGDISWVTQEQQLGTGHAVLCARNAFDGFSGDLLILSGDVPLIEPGTLQAMLARHRAERAAM